MNRNLCKKGMVLGIIFLFFGAGVVPSISANIVKIDNTGNGNTIFYNSNAIIVPDNYTIIQDAIDNATDGDTIFVRNGIYYQNISIDRSIKLIGENKDNTIIDGNGSSCVINILVNNVNIMGFTIRGADNSNCYGIKVLSDTNTIFGNTITTNNGGILLEAAFNNYIISNIIEKSSSIGITLLQDSSYNKITNNIFIDNYECIQLMSSCCNNISYNTIDGSTFHGIFLSENSEKNNFYGNYFTNNLAPGSYAIYVGYGSNNNNFSCNNFNLNDGCIHILADNTKILGNVFTDNSININIDTVSEYTTIMGNTIESARIWGIIIMASENNRIYCNNFINNFIDVSFSDCIYTIYRNNYWDKPRYLPKIIFGQMGVIPWFNFDLFPAQEPY